MKTTLNASPWQIEIPQDCPNRLQTPCQTKNGENLDVKKLWDNIQNQISNSNIQY